MAPDAPALPTAAQLLSARQETPYNAAPPAGAAILVAAQDVPFHSSVNPNLLVPETFVLKIPETLPYGGSFQGPGEFDRFFQRIVDNQDYWSLFRTELALGRVLDAGTHLVAPIRVTARPKSSEETITIENLWLFEIADGNFVRAQLYADTAAASSVGR